MRGPERRLQEANAAPGSRRGPRRGQGPRFVVVSCRSADRPAGARPALTGVRCARTCAYTDARLASCSSRLSRSSRWIRSTSSRTGRCRWTMSLSCCRSALSIRSTPARLWRRRSLPRRREPPARSVCVALVCLLCVSWMAPVNAPALKHQSRASERSLGRSGNARHTRFSAFPKLRQMGEREPVGRWPSCGACSSHSRPARPPAS